VWGTSRVMSRCCVFRPSSSVAILSTLSKAFGAMSRWVGQHQRERTHAAATTPSASEVRCVLTVWHGLTLLIIKLVVLKNALYIRILN
jgi:hypothetical protein